MRNPSLFVKFVTIVIKGLFTVWRESDEEGSLDRRRM